MSEIFIKSFLNEVEKIAGKKCPGSKIRSGGKGRGLGIGDGEGPIGRMKNFYRNRHDPKWAKKQWMKQGFTSAQADKLIKATGKK